MNTIKENLFVQSLGFPGDVGNWDNNTIYFKEGAVSTKITVCSNMRHAYKNIVIIRLKNGVFQF